MFEKRLFSETTQSDFWRFIPTKAKTAPCGTERFSLNGALCFAIIGLKIMMNTRNWDIS